MIAETLNCPNCGAAISAESANCQYCESKMATIACGSCFGMMFIGSRHCPHCGVAASQATPSQLSVLKCPRCKVDMSAISIGGEVMRECEHCNGLWLEVSAFDRICANREQQSAVLGGASVAPTSKLHPDSNSEKVRYIPCPQCGQLMNRINFACCSGVIVDVCKGHGTWFDESELREIVEFIRGGGLELARQKEKHELESERQKLASMQALNGARSEVAVGNRSVTILATQDRIDGLSAARALLKFLIE